MNVLFIDSGIGGLTTLASAIKRIPNLNFIYYADDKYSPYGSLTQEQILSRLKSIISSQLHKNIGLIVLACNTATANAIDDLRKNYFLPIIGIEPAIKPVSTLGNRVLILATPATTKHKRFFKLISNCPCSVEISPMPMLAKQIDNYFLYGDEFCKDEIEITINQIKALCYGKTHIVLGCTHYVHLKKLIKDATGKIVVDGNDGVANQLAKKIDNRFTSHNPLQKFIVSSKNAEVCKKYKKIFLQTLANTNNV